MPHRDCHIRTTLTYQTCNLIGKSYQVYLMRSDFKKCVDWRKYSAVLWFLIAWVLYYLLHDLQFLFIFRPFHVILTLQRDFRMSVNVIYTLLNMPLYFSNGIKWTNEDHRHGYFYVTYSVFKVVGFSESLCRTSQIPANITSSEVSDHNWSTYLPSLTLEVFFTPSVTQWMWTWHPVITRKRGDFQEIKSQLI